MKPQKKPGVGCTISISHTQTLLLLVTMVTNKMRTLGRTMIYNLYKRLKTTKWELMWYKKQLSLPVTGER